jgi:hypothetical protein
MLNRGVSGKGKKRAVMLANRSSSNQREAREKAKQTRRLRNSENQHLEQSQKRARRAGTDYQAPFGKGTNCSFFVYFFHVMFERLDASPAPLFTPVTKSRAEKLGRRKSGKHKKRASPLDNVTPSQRRTLKKWILTRSMPEGERNLTGADILEHIQETYGIRVRVFVL